MNINFETCHQFLKEKYPQGAMLSMNVDKLRDTCRPVMVLDLVLSSASFS